MGWMIGIATYVVLLMAVLLIVGGRRRGDLRHAAAVNELAAYEGLRDARADTYRRPAPARVEQRAQGERLGTRQRA